LTVGGTRRNYSFLPDSKSFLVPAGPLDTLGIPPDFLFLLPPELEPLSGIDFDVLKSLEPELCEEDVH
jgi:hypothetical protein